MENLSTALATIRKTTIIELFGEEIETDVDIDIIKQIVEAWNNIDIWWRLIKSGQIRWVKMKLDWAKNAEELIEFVEKRNEKTYKAKWKFKKKKLPQVVKINEELIKTRTRRRKEYSVEEIGQAVMKYMSVLEINDYIPLFDLYSFIKQTNWLDKYINS